jgi:hypothetical protein
MQNDDLEARLKSLSPVSGRVDAVTAAYTAGQQSSHRTINRWRSVAGMVALLAVAPWMMPKPKTAVVAPQQLAISEPPPVADQFEPVPPGNMWQLQAAVLEKGLDGLPKTVLPSAKPTRAFDIY